MHGTHMTDSPDATIARIGAAARQAQAELAYCDAARKAEALGHVADMLLQESSTILAANARDMATAEAAGLDAARLDRLYLDQERLAGIVESMQAIAAFPDPVGRILDRRTRPNGLVIERVAVPLGVIGVIFEARPNVTADAAALCLKAGNAVILRAGSEALHSALAIGHVVRTAIAAHGLPQDAVQVIAARDRALVSAMLRARDVIDVIVPRGGKNLVALVNREARMPVFSHLEGVCHLYVDRAADFLKAEQILINAKCRRVSVCGALETLLVDSAIAAEFVPAALEALAREGVEIRGDAHICRLFPAAIPAEEDDWSREYLDKILSVRVVDGVAGAVAHINRYGSHHTDSIATEDADTARYFLQRVDSAIVMHNASTQFADGGEFGLGAEIGIATGRMHARGPVGCEQLTCFHYRVHGTGQCRD